MTTLKPAVKRGALIAAANWPVTLVQASVDSLFKLLLAAPVVGGVFLVALAVGSEPRSLLTLEWREMAATIVSSLMTQPLVLTAFLLSVASVAIGGSLVVFLAKAGTVATLMRSEWEAGAIEEPPLQVSLVAEASRCSVDFYLQSARAFFPRYARLGCTLIAVYLASGVTYLTLMVNRVGGDSWGVTALATVTFVAWITVVNLVYLLMQIAIVADDSSVAFAALCLVAFVPFVGLAALPLQLVAWMLRALVFQYLGLTAVGAFLRLYRMYAAVEAAPVPYSASVRATPAPPLRPPMQL